MSTILHRLSRWAEEAPSAHAQMSKKDGTWAPVTAKEYRDRVFHLALFLESRGFTPQDIVAILAYNRPEWVQLDLAPQLLGGMSAGLYPNASQKDIDYILKHTAAKILGVQNKEYFGKITHGGGELPSTVELVLVFEGDAGFHPKAMKLADAIAEGAKMADGKKFDDYLKKIDPKAGAFLIYTSGTTGNPKGAVLTHDNLVYASDLTLENWPILKKGRTMISFLPLCHIAEKLQNIGVGITGRFAAYYCTAFDKLTEELGEVQPDVLLCVPRLWEKMVEGVNQKLEAAPSVRRKLAEWAFGVGRRITEARLNGKLPNPIDLAQKPLADKLVLGKVRKALGLSNCIGAASGAAPLPPHVTQWFWGLGLEIYEDYGMTETAGVITQTTPGRDCSGTVGRPLRGTDFRIAEDGEILTRGRHVFQGYYKNEEATRDTIDSDGWLHSGDLGVIDEHGYIRIRGRKREILKTSGGKMVAPAPIEQRIKEAPEVSQVCIVGDGRKYFTALVTLSEGLLNELKVKAESVKGKVVTDPEIVNRVNVKFEEINAELAGFERIKSFKVLAREFSIEEGEMTPTLKMKRNVIESNFRDIIDEMYM